MIPVRNPAVRLAVALACGMPFALSAAEATTDDLEEVYVYGRSLEATLPQELAGYGSDLVSIGRSSIEQQVYADPQQALRGWVQNGLQRCIDDVVVPPLPPALQRVFQLQPVQPQHALLFTSAQYTLAVGRAGCAHSAP